MRGLALFAGIIACSGSIACSRSGGSADPGVPSTGGTTQAATPVQLGQVTRSNLAVIVSGPGRTDVINEQRVRAPFTGMLLSLSIAPGDHVGTGQPIGTIVSQTSQAALAGAQAMLAAARTPAERADARRAVAVASAGIVRTVLRAPQGGIVLSRAASPGELVTAGDSLASIAATGSLVFVAQLAQGDAIRVHRGQSARITLSGATMPLSGTVHAILPADSAGGLTVPVRIDLSSGQTPITLGLFGTAQIVVAERRNVIAVPTAAVLRNDITGISQIAVVTGKGTAHWVTVTTGTSQGNLVEITSPAMPVGSRVITTGQVGLPEGTRVRPAVARDSLVP